MRLQSEPEDRRLMSQIQESQGETPRIVRRDGPRESFFSTQPSLLLESLTGERLRPTHIGEAGPLDSLIQMLSSSRNTLIDIPRNNVSLSIWAPPHGPAKLTHAIHHHASYAWPKLPIVSAFWVCRASRVCRPVPCPTSSPCEGK